MMLLAALARLSFTALVDTGLAKDRWDRDRDRRSRHYDRYCREQYYYDKAEARRAGRRAGVVVGLGVREIVRD